MMRRKNNVNFCSKDFLEMLKEISEQNQNKKQ